ncbi:hypothetical protein KIH87_12385 [Paraneptunicella aestuarii]|uniref:hypothetical protein n=1 Tax=Paraneptunicella aestuarii TaxID=2831148 RepID=UPI001E363936|nr:hypothetical protein [Paraneptunicella aestuarii]UAA37510.1 hypothetical protein KIH87_12385 [Paraneptunicella aestuarii]
MISAKEILPLTPAERKQLLLEDSNAYQAKNEFERCQRLSHSINKFIEDYFKQIQLSDRENNIGSILQEFNIPDAIMHEINKFKPIAINEITTSISSKNSESPPANIYELAGAHKLAGGNKTSRNLSTALNQLWHNIANISPYVVSPEQDFNIKLKGIDLIIHNTSNKKVEYVQLKTQQNTMTGSQKGRTIDELSIYSNPVFCAVFSLGIWTFNHDVIPRRSGAEFWQSIGIHYPTFERHALELLQMLENEYSRS